ncbi:MAG: DUF4843 domain-containing protein [Prevotella sp.]|nr:DUF4843 domain-containing protein [Prevotella sp.]
MNNKIIIPLLLVCMFCSCKEEHVQLYDTDNNEVYFTYESRGQRDSVNYTFFTAGDKITQDTVWVKISLLGSPSDKDRPIELRQVNSGTPDAAVEGKHYLSFTTQEMNRYLIIPKGEVTARVPVVLYRTDDLKSSNKRLEFTILENSYFRTGIDSRDKFVITTTDKAVKPNNWDQDWYMYFGIWGSEKMRFIISVTGYNDWDTRLQFELAQLGYWLVNTCKQKLLEYNESHPGNPLCEEDGTPIEFL